MTTIGEQANNEWIIRDGAHAGMHVFLLTLEQFKALPPETPLVDIFGEQGIKEHADDDTRGGYVAWGLASEVVRP